MECNDYHGSLVATIVQLVLRTTSINNKYRLKYLAHTPHWWKETIILFENTDLICRYVLLVTVIQTVI